MRALIKDREYPRETHLMNILQARREGKQTGLQHVSYCGVEVSLASTAARKTCSSCWVTAAHVRCRAVSCAADPRLLRNSVEWHKLSTAAVTCAESAGGTRRPLTPFSTMSAMPQAFVVTNGIALAMASSSVSGMPSTSEGKTKM